MSCNLRYPQNEQIRAKCLREWPMRGEDSCLLRTACISVWVRQLDSTALVNLSTSWRVKNFYKKIKCLTTICKTTKRKQLFDVYFEERRIPTEPLQVLSQGRVILLIFRRLCRISRSIETSKIRKLLLKVCKFLYCTLHQGHTVIELIFPYSIAEGGGNCVPMYSNKCSEIRKHYTKAI